MSTNYLAFRNSFDLVGQQLRQWSKANVIKSLGKFRIKNFLFFIDFLISARKGMMMKMKIQQLKNVNLKLSKIQQQQQRPRPSSVILLKKIQQKTNDIYLVVIFFVQLISNLSYCPCNRRANVKILINCQKKFSVSNKKDIFFWLDN